MNNKILFGIIAVAFVVGLFAPAFAGLSTDFGDAPDGAPTGYAGLFAQTGSFPTLLANDGARSLDATQVTLGAGATFETDANTVDGLDNGVQSFVIFLISIPPPAVMTVNVNSNLGSPATYFFNVLIDLNLSGQWSDPNPGDLGEWVVANRQVTINPGNNVITTEPFAFGFGNRLPDGAWMRVSITKEAVTPSPTGWLGNGQFSSGEIEDYQISLGTSGDPPKKPTDPAVECIGGPKYYFNMQPNLQFQCKITNMGATGNVLWSFKKESGEVTLQIINAPPPGATNPGPAKKVNGQSLTAGGGGMSVITLQANNMAPLPSKWTVWVQDPPFFRSATGIIAERQVGTSVWFDDSATCAACTNYSGALLDENGIPFSNSNICRSNFTVALVSDDDTTEAQYFPVNNDCSYGARLPPGVTGPTSLILLTEGNRAYYTFDQYPLNPLLGDQTGLNFNMVPILPTPVNFHFYGDELPPNGAFDPTELPLPTGPGAPHQMDTWVVNPQGVTSQSNAPPAHQPDWNPSSMHQEGLYTFYKRYGPGTQTEPANFDYIHGVVGGTSSSSISQMPNARITEGWMQSSLPEQSIESSVSTNAIVCDDATGDAVVPPLGTIAHDICTVKAEYDAASGKIVFEITTVGSFVDPSLDLFDGLAGLIEIDADQNPATGGFGAIPGSEFSIQFFDPFGGTPPSTAVVFETTTFASTQAPITYGTNSLTFELDPCVLGGDAFDHYTAVGNVFGQSDEYPTFGSVVTSTGTPTCPNPPIIVPNPSNFAAVPLATVDLFYGYALGGDDDGDGIPNLIDNCPNDANPGQEDLDMDGTGDACDLSNMIIVDKTLTTDHSVIGDVIVQAGVTLTVPSPHSLTLNSVNLIVAGTVVVDGGSIIVS